MIEVDMVVAVDSSSLVSVEPREHELIVVGFKDSSSLVFVGPRELVLIVAVFDFARDKSSVFD